MSRRFVRLARLALLALSALTLVAACANGGNHVRPDLGHMPGDAGDDATHGDAGRSDMAIDSGDVDTGLDDAGDVDLGADGGALDFGSDSGPDLGPPDAGCTSAASCDDGIACDGVERCIGGFCSPGTAIVCDDGIACTRDACSEPFGVCGFMPDDTLCAPGSRCTAPTASGCATTSTCGESPCRLVAPQCGCGPGLSCTIAGTSRVCSAPGTGTSGAACTGPCATGNLCVTLSATPGTPSACETFCTTTSDCTGTGSHCVLTLDDGTGGSIPGVTLCSISCTPTGTGTAGCPTGSACRVFTDASGAGLTQCTGVGTAGAGAACASDDDCVAGDLCVNTGTGGMTCHPICTSVGLACGGGGGTCTGFMTPLIVDGTQYGVCI